jgi:hypothetical protein
MNNANMQETVFYMGLQVSKWFELEKEHLTVDTYYETILTLVNHYEFMGYGKLNMGLLDTINKFINDYETQIRELLKNNYVSESKQW